MKTNKRNGGFLSGKGFYIALGVCMVAIGISAWAAMGNMTQNDDTAASSKANKNVVSNTTSELSANKPESEISASSKEDEAPSEEISSSEITEPVETAAPIAKYFKYPVAGEIIKGFSDTELQYSLTYDDMRLHTGTDIKANQGTSVKASGDGVVLATENDPLLGYTVKIDHGNGIVAVYGGLSKAIAVKKGDTVKCGTNLGPLGTVTTECVDAPHLHLEFYKNNKPIDPMSLISE